MFSNIKYGWADFNFKGFKGVCSYIQDPVKDICQALIDTFEDNSKEDKAQNIFYSDEYCENNCNDIYKDCWLKYFKELQKAKGDVKNEI